MVPILIPNDTYNQRDIVLSIPGKQEGSLGHLAQGSVWGFVLLYFLC